MNDSEVRSRTGLIDRQCIGLKLGTVINYLVED
jgi:hypothetical protein